ncbi:MAG: hypothetical protein ACTHU0_19115 [Kofleriaceae bacterium]
MIGPRIGLRTGSRVGPAVGVSADELGGDVEPTTTSLSVSVVASSDPVISWREFGYFVRIANTGVIGATGVSVVVTLGAGLTFQLAYGEGWTVSGSGNVVTCTRATLAPGPADDIVIVVRSPDAAGSPTVSATAQAANAGPSGGSTTTTVKLVDRDSTSGMRVPSTVQQWDDLFAFHVANGTPDVVVGSPSFGWMLQDAGGDPAAAFGGPPLIATGLEYQQAQPGWTRTGIQTTHNASDSAMTASVALPDIGATSAMLLTYVAIASTPTATRGVAALGNTGTTGAKAHVNTTPAIIGISGTNTATGLSIGTGVIPLIIQHNRSAGLTTVFTQHDKIAPTFSTLATGTLLQLGATNASAAAARYLAAWLFVGAAAERTPAQVMALQEVLGWGPGWSP